MSKLQASVYLFVAYFVCSFLLCGDMVTPLADLPIMSPSRSRDFWNIFVVVSLVVAVTAASPWVTPAIWPEFRPALFTTIWMICSALSAGIYGTWKLNEAIAEFHADKVIKNSFFRSLHEVPREFQFYIHAGLMKDCKPYIWSYSALAFYPIEPDRAVNVLPQSWMDECKIKRS